MSTMRLLMWMALLLASGAACRSNRQTDAGDPAAPGSTRPGAIERSPYVEPADPAPSAVDPEQAPAQADRYTLDGLVGQVNGKPVYARTILGPLDEQLAQIARQNSGQAFENEVLGASERPGLLTLRVNEVVQDALILGEAERDLSEQEQQGLAIRLEEHRAELLRLHGQGSVAVAEQTLRDQQGKTLAEAIEEYRARIVVQRYLQLKLFPRINVTRRDIERYYNDHPEQFNPPAKRVVRLISVTHRADADAVVQALAAPDADFAQLAAGPLNRFKPAEGGRMELTSQAPLAVAALNEQLQTLEVGRHAGPFAADNGAWWFIHLETFDRGESKPLKDVQVSIEQTLRRQQFDLLRGRFLRQLYEQGSYTPVDEMVSRLYAIVEARYKAAPQPL